MDNHKQIQFEKFEQSLELFNLDSPEKISTFVDKSKIISDSNQNFNSSKSIKISGRVILPYNYLAKDCNFCKYVFKNFQLSRIDHNMEIVRSKLKAELINNSSYNNGDYNLVNDFYKDVYSSIPLKYYGKTDKIEGNVYRNALNDIFQFNKAEAGICYVLNNKLEYESHTVDLSNKKGCFEFKTKPFMKTYFDQIEQFKEKHLPEKCKKMIGKKGIIAFVKINGKEYYNCDTEYFNSNEKDFDSLIINNENKAKNIIIPLNGITPLDISNTIKKYIESIDLNNPEVRSKNSKELTNLSDTTLKNIRSLKLLIGKIFTEDKREEKLNIKFNWMNGEEKKILNEAHNLSTKILLRSFRICALYKNLEPDMYKWLNPETLRQIIALEILYERINDMHKKGKSKFQNIFRNDKQNKIKSILENEKHEDILNFLKEFTGKNNIDEMFVPIENYCNELIKSETHNQFYSTNINYLNKLENLIQEIKKMILI